MTLCPKDLSKFKTSTKYYKENSHLIEEAMNEIDSYTIKKLFATRLLGLKKFLRSVPYGID